MAEKLHFSVATLQPGIPYVAVPQKRAPVLRFLVWLVEKIMGKELLPARVLLWYPKALVSSAVLEALVAHRVKSLGRRLLKLVRMQASFAVSCPFCIDMNSYRHQNFGISQEEVLALQGKIPLEQVSTFTRRERIALQYARSASGTPLRFSARLIAQLQQHFSDREIVILASTISQVNYWGRLIQALGLPPAGFDPQCPYLHLDQYNTLVQEEGSSLENSTDE